MRKLWRRSVLLSLSFAQLQELGLHVHGVELGFEWIPSGETVKNLGFHMGLDTTLAQQFVLIISCIRTKLSH